VVAEQRGAGTLEALIAQEFDMVHQVATYHPSVDCISTAIHQPADSTFVREYYAFVRKCFEVLLFYMHSQ
jgi:hypothetical protein